MDIFTVIASFISGLLCSMGFGGGSILIIFLTSFMDMGQKEAQGTNLFFFIPCALYSVIKYKKSGLIETKMLKVFIPLGILGVGIGYAIINFIPAEFLRKIFGAFLTIMGVKDIFTKSKGTAYADTP